MYEMLTLDTSKQNILRIQLNRPKALNALNIKLLSEIKDIFDHIEDYTARLIVIEGNVKAFAAGADITEIQGLSSAEATAFSQSGQAIFRKIEESTIPTIALIQGYALGGGLELAMACHMRVANESARMGMPEINLGLLPGYEGTQRLGRLIGRSKAMELTLTGNMISGRQAEQLGLVGSCFTDDEFDMGCDKMLHKLAGKAPIAAKCIIESINSSLNSENNGAQKESEFFGELMKTKDLNEGISAFLEKRKAIFIGE